MNIYCDNRVNDVRKSDYNEVVILDKKKEKQRIEWIDNGKFICICAVIISHLPVCPNYIKEFIFPFFLTTFFFLSGYTYKNNLSFKNHIKKKTKGLLVPWFFLSIFNIVSSQLISFNSHESFSIELMKMFLQIRGYGDTLWFVACLFLAFIPFYFIIKYIPKENKGGIFSFLLMLCSIFYCQYFPETLFPWGNNSLPWHIQIIFVGMFFMYLGYIYKIKYEEKLKKFESWKYIGIILALYITLLLINHFYINYSYIGIDLYGKEIFFWMITVFTGLIFVILLAKKTKSNKLISFIGKNTLLYFGLHGKIYSLIEWIIYKTFIIDYIYSNIVFQSIYAITEMVIILIILIPPIIVINKFFPFIMGRWYRPKSN